MAEQALIVFGISVFVFVVTALVVRKERQRERRFFAPTVRSWLDHWVVRFESWVGRTWQHFTRYILQLHWYYSIHSVLRGALRVIVAMYTYLEALFERNRHRAKQLRAEKRQLGELNHLQQMATHKEETALTPTQKRKLRKQKLEERH